MCPAEQHLMNALRGMVFVLRAFTWTGMMPLSLAADAGIACVEMKYHLAPIYGILDYANCEAMLIR